MSNSRSGQRAGDGALIRGALALFRDCLFAGTAFAAADMTTTRIESCQFAGDAQLSADQVAVAVFVNSGAPGGGEVAAGTALGT